MGPKHGFKTQIHNTNPMTCSHEHSQVNPCIQMGSNKVIQHPTMAAGYCQNSGCKTQICNLNDPKCDKTPAVKAIRHGTYSDSSRLPSAQYLSKSDLDGNKGPQFYPEKDRTTCIKSRPNI